MSMARGLTSFKGEAASSSAWVGGGGGVSAGELPVLSELDPGLVGDGEGGGEGELKLKGMI